MAYFSFDTDDIESGLIPDGTVVKAVIAETDILDRDWFYDRTGDPKDRDKGKRMPITAVVVEGQWEGSRISDGFNICHPNPQTQSIGQKQLKRLCDAVGVPKFRDTSELHGKAFLLTVKLEPAKGDWDEKNRFGKMEQCADAAPVSSEEMSTPWAIEK